MYGLEFSLVSPQLLVIYCASDLKTKQNKKVPKNPPKQNKTTPPNNLGPIQYD